VISLLNANETVFFSHVEGCLRQWVDLRLSNDSVNEISAVLTITAGGEAVETRLLIRSGEMIYRAYAPVQWPRPSEESWLSLRTGEQQLETRICLGHQRPWTVYLLSDVCNDYVWAYDAEESMRADDAALTKAELDAGTHYNFVHSREIEFFLEHYPDQAERLFNALGSGQMTLNPVLNMSLYGCMSLEEIIRSFYPARRLARQQGLTDVYANIQESPPADGAVANGRRLDVVSFEDVANGGLGCIAAQLKELALDLTIAPPGILLGQAENQAFECLIGAGSTASVLGSKGPLAAHQSAMPCKHGFGFEQAQDGAQLIGWFVGHLFQLGGKHGKQHFLGLAGSDGLVLLPQQNIQLLAKDEDFYDFVLFGNTNEADEGKQKREGLRQDKPTHMRLISM
jgi:hypothetical protein